MALQIRRFFKELDAFLDNLRRLDRLMYFLPPRTLAALSTLQRLLRMHLARRYLLALPPATPTPTSTSTSTSTSTAKKGSADGAPLRPAGPPGRRGPHNVVALGGGFWADLGHVVQLEVGAVVE
jgi:hypothetical protein